MQISMSTPPYKLVKLKPDLQPAKKFTQKIAAQFGLKPKYEGN